MTPPPGDAAAEPTSRLVLDDVHKSFGDVHVLRGIDLTVDDHEVVCLIGPSGCGKSTTLRCIDLLDPIDRGRILLDGDDLTARRASPTVARRRMAIVFQSFNLFPHLSVLANITLGPRKVHDVPRGEAEDRARELLERFGLGEHADQYPERLSGGQQQRAAIVRAIATEPDLLLLDEITSALDPELVGDVLGVIRELADDGMTMVIATHEMGFARDVADRVCFLHEGLILESGPPQQILSEPREDRTRSFLSRIIDSGRL